MRFKRTTDSQGRTLYESKPSWGQMIFEGVLVMAMWGVIMLTLFLF